MAFAPKKNVVLVGRDGVSSNLKVKPLLQEFPKTVIGQFFLKFILRKGSHGFGLGCALSVIPVKVDSGKIHIS